MASTIYQALCFFVIISAIAVATGESLTSDGCPDGEKVIKSFPETSPIGTVLIVIRDVDNIKMKPDSKNIYKHLQVTKMGRNFTVTLKNKLDFEKYENMTFLNIPFTCNHINNWALVIAITNVMDSELYFALPHYSFNVREDMKVGTEVGILEIKTAESLDHLNQYLNATLIHTSAFALNLIGRDKFSIVVQHPHSLDYEINTSLSFECVAWYNDKYKARTNITVNIIDVDDSNPKFTQTTYYTNIWENSTVPYNWSAPVHAFDPDKGINEDLNYKLIGGWPGKPPFTINKSTAKITANESLDREKTAVYIVLIEAHQVHNNTFRKDTAQVVITVSDINDNAPVFKPTSFQVSIPENLPVNTTILRVSATDDDEGNNAAFQYQLDDNGKSQFHINSKTGEINVRNNSQLDREKTEKIQFMVFATEISTQEKRHDTANVTINLIDENDNSPKFNETMYNFSPVDKNITISTIIGNVHATDLDSESNGKVTYRIEGYDSQRFSITNYTGQIKVIQSLGTNYQRWYNFTAIAEDSALLSRRRSSSVEVSLQVRDVNMHSPVLHHTTNVVNITEDTEIGTIIAEFHATDADIDDTLTFSIRGSESFVIDPHSGEVTIEKALDMETANMYQLNVSVSDGLRVGGLHSNPIIKLKGIECAIVKLYQELHKYDMGIDSTFLTIYIEDINDNKPIFDKEQYNFTIEEETHPQDVGKIHATDKDKTSPNNKLSFDIEKSQWSDSFEIKKEGNITLTRAIDREKLAANFIYLTIKVTDHGFPPLNNYSVVIVTVNDVNDNAPKIMNNNVSVTFDEMSQPKDVYTIHVTDKDSTSKNQKVAFRILPPQFSTNFTVNQTTGTVKALQPLTIPDTGSVKITIEVSNIQQYVGNFTKNASMTLYIHVNDVNNHLPKFSSTRYNYSIREDCPTGSLTKCISNYTRIHAHDDDASPQNNEVTYWISENENNTFFIDRKTADLYLLEPLDFETTKHYSLTILASDLQPFYTGGTIKNSTTQVQIDVSDVNDIVPKFEQDIYQCSAPENFTGVIHCNITAHDKESYPNGGALSYSLQGLLSDIFHVDNSTGAISLTKRLEYSPQHAKYKGIIAASDHGIPPLTGSASVVITLTDVNNHAPVFEDIHNFTINEGLPRGTFVGSIAVTDNDKMDNITFSIINNEGTGYIPFRLEDSLSGGIIIQTRNILDREEAVDFTFEIQANDSVHVVQHQVKIAINDINDNAPLFEHSQYNLTFKENDITKNLTVQATDRDKTSPNNILAYEIGDSTWSDHFNIDGQGLLTVTKPFDREDLDQSNIVLSLIAKDGGNPPLKNSCIVQVEVQDINDNAPEFIIGNATFVFNENDKPSNFFTAEATDKDATDEFKKLQFNIVDSHYSKLFSINQSTGVVFAVKSLVIPDTEPMEISIQVSNTKPYSGDRATMKLHIYVNDINNHSPRFNESYSSSIPENATTGIPIHLNSSLQAYDDDVSAKYSTITYWISDGNKNNTFYMDHKTGKLYLQKSLDFETKSMFNLTISASDMQYPSSGSDTIKNETTQVIIHVTDVNDNRPQFSKDHYNCKVSENFTGPFGCSVQATDMDKNSRIQYLFQNNSEFFNIINNGTIICTKKLDYELPSQRKFEITVLAEDNGHPALTGTSTLTIDVTNENDNEPALKGNYQFSIEENQESTILGIIYATDADGDDLSYTIEPPEPVGGIANADSCCSKNSAYPVRINTSTSGINFLTTTKPLNREECSMVNFTIKVNDSHHAMTHPACLRIMDVNDMKPNFTQTRYEVSIDEGVSAYSVLVKAEDKDESSPNNQVSYDILCSTGSDFFDINNVGNLTLSKPLDREDLNDSKIYLTIIATDHGDPSLVSSALVIVTVNDVNDNDPEFHVKNVTFVFKEGSQPLKFYEAEVTDNDLTEENMEMIFHLSTTPIYTSYFTIDNSSGIVSASKPLTVPTEEFIEVSIMAANVKSPARVAEMKMIIYVEDINDNSPVFIKQPYTVSLPENASTGIIESIMQIKAQDDDVTTQYNTLTYWISDGNDGDTFYIDQRTAELFLMKSLDYENMQQYNLSISASDMQPSSGDGKVKNVTTYLTVNITDVNDNAPVFTQSQYNFTITERNTTGILKVEANDGDITEKYHQIDYELIQRSDIFHIAGGNITLIKPIDREQLSSEIIHLEVIAKDKGTPALIGSSVVQVTVLDVNDNVPVFNENNVTFVFDEGSKPVDFYTPHIMDKDATWVNREVRFCLKSSTEYVSINSSTGVVTAAKSLTFDAGGYMHLTIICKNVQPYYDGGLHDSEMTMYIYVKGINKYPPSFSGHYNYSIPENFAGGIIDMGNNRILAHDNDSSPQYNTITYWISDGNVNKTFYIDQRTAELFLMKPLDYEKITQYNLSISASDLQPTSRNATTQVLIAVTDTNDIAPKFDAGYYNCYVRENFTGLLTSCVIKATDPEMYPNGGELSYSLSKYENIFTIDGMSGIMKIISSLDYETQNKTYEMVAYAADHGNPALSGSATIVVDLVDVNDNVPVFDEIPEITLNEELPNDTYIGSITATDKDNNDVLTYTLVGSTDFWINPNVGAIFTNRTFDYDESDRGFDITVRVSDKNVHENSATIHVKINNINDNNPVFDHTLYTVSIPENSPTKELVLQVNASDKDNLGKLRYKFLNGGNMFRIDNSSGRIYVNRSPDYETTRQYSLLVEVNDGGIPIRRDESMVKISILNVNDEPPKFVSQYYSSSFAENNKIGSKILQVFAEDADSEIGSLIFSVENNTESFKFMNNTLTSIKSLDCESKSEYFIDISVFDGNYTGHSSVHIDLIDVNEFRPRFRDCGSTKCSFITTIPYSAEDGRHMLKINVTDEDVSNKGFTFFLMDTYGIFIINETTGDVFYHSDDRYRLSLNTTYDLQVQVFDYGSPPKFNTASLKVFIDTSNLNTPSFGNQTYYTSVYENATLMQHVITVSATDHDANLAGTVRYDIIDGGLGVFIINASTGEIRVNGTLDYESRQTYTLKVRGRDLAQDSRSSSSMVQIKIINVNEVPKFTKVVSTACTTENIKNGTTVAIVEVIDEPGRLDFSLLHHGDLFTIKQNSLESARTKTASIIANKMINSSEIGTIVLNITVTDSQGLFNVTALKLQSGTKGNPVFQPSFMSVTVEENEKPRYVIVDVNTTSEITGKPVSYSLFKSSLAHWLNIDPNTGIIYGDEGLAWKRGNSSFSVEVNAQNDHGNCSAIVTINIHDKNDHTPYLIDCCFTPLLIPERNITSGGEQECVKNVTASDDDNYSMLSISVSNANEVPFAVKQVDDTTACLYVNESIDFESLSPNHAYIVQLMVSDGERSSGNNLTIEIGDVNDNYPEFSAPSYVINVTEDTRINSEVGHLSATDSDTMDGSAITYTLEQRNGSQFTLETVNGVAILKLASALDMETQSMYNITVIATDTGNHSTTTTVHVSVLDVNDNSPIFTNHTYIYRQQEGNSSLTFKKEIKITDDDEGENAKATFEIISGNEGNHFNVSSCNNTATLFVQKELDREDPLLRKADGVGKYTLLLVAKDNGQPSRSASATILVYVTDINDCVPEFSQKHYESTITEGVSRDVSVFTVTARDCDYQPNITYAIIGRDKDKFTIHPESGEIFPATRITYGTNYNVEVQACDGIHSNTTKIVFSVIDVNDNDPEFTENPYKFSVEENDDNDEFVSLVGLVSASDNDTGRNGNVTYRIISPDVSKLFQISSNDGHIETIGKLDRDTCLNNRYTFTVIAEDQGLSRRTGYTEVVVIILDINDNAPSFGSNLYNGSIHENAELGTEVVILPVIRATDVDEGVNGTEGIRFFLTGDGALYFRIETEGNDKERIGRVYVNRSCQPPCLDRELRDTYRLQIWAQDHNGTGMKRNATLVIHITDENDESPVFESELYSFKVYENVTDSAFIGKVIATDQDINGNKSIRYTISHGSDGKFFIDKEQGYIYVSGSLDREKKDIFILNITASDGSNDIQTTVNISVLDCNDNSPLFQPSVINIEVEENGAANITIGNITATDRDKGENGFVSYFTNDTRESSKFEVTESGEIVVLTSLDREKKDLYTFSVYARDNGDPRRISRATVKVTVKDTNDNPPRFYDDYDKRIIHYKNVSILEKSPVSSPIAWLRVIDRDTGINKDVTFRLNGTGHRHFGIDHVGIVTIKDKIDRNLLIHEGTVKDTTSNSSVIDLYVIATDGGLPALSTALTLSVIVEGINDDAPTFEHPSYEFRVAENVTVDTLVGTVHAISNADFTVLKYYIVSGVNSSTFKIDIEQGNITTKTALDREEISEYTFAVRVTDGKIPERTAFTVVKVIIEDINDNAPVPKQASITLSWTENRSPSKTKIQATDADAGRNAVLHYSLLHNETDNLITINATTGELYLNGTLDREATPTLLITVEITDDGSPQKSSRAQVTINVEDINDNSPKFNTTLPHCSVLENSPPGTEVCKISAVDPDLGLNGSVVYKLLEDTEPFFIGPVDGILRTLGTIDYENRTSYNLSVQASDLGHPTMTSFTNITVSVQDVYDTEAVPIVPRFNKTSYEANISPYTQANVSIIQVYAGFNVIYTIKDSDGTFDIDARTGSVTLNRTLDGSAQEYILIVHATNSDYQDLQDTTAIVVHVQHQKYASFPRSNYPVSVEENTLNELVLIDLNTTQEDMGQTVTYKIVSVHPEDNNFTIDPKTGKVMVHGPFDREENEQYNLYIQATVVDDLSTRRKKRASNDVGGVETMVTVYVKDKNDNSPRFELDGKGQLEFYVSKSLGAGDFVAKVTAHDPDLLNHVKYNLTRNDDTPSSTFLIDANNGEIHTLSRLDKLEGSEQILKLSASDEFNPPTHVKAKMILVPVSSRVIFVAPLTPTEFLENKGYLIRNMSNILGLRVHLEKVLSHIQSKSNDQQKSDLYLFATKNSTVLSTEELTNSINVHIRAIQDLFKCIDNSVCVIISEPVSHTPYTWSAAEIALLTIAIIIFLATIVGTIILRHVWKEFDAAKQQEVQMFELQSQHSGHSDDFLEMINPNYSETKFGKDTDGANEIDTESQERIVVFEPEHQLNGADSGVENDSSSSNNDSTDAGGLTPEVNNKEQSNSASGNNFIDVDSASSGQISRHDSLIGSSAHSSVVDVRDIQVHQPQDGLVADIQMTDDAEVGRSMIVIDMDVGDTDDSEVVLDSTLNKNQNLLTVQLDSTEYIQDEDNGGSVKPNITFDNLIKTADYQSESDNESKNGEDKSVSSAGTGLQVIPSTAMSTEESSTDFTYSTTENEEDIDTQL